MSSDIDIYEHLLQHPAIKIEVDSDDEEMAEYDEPFYLNTSVLDETNQEPFIDTEFHQVSGNKIILGSKPKIDKDPLSARVMLKDWKYILRKHPFYCHECLILFPTQNTIDAHRMIAHSLLVPIKEENYSPPSNKAKKSTTKSIVCGNDTRNEGRCSQSSNTARKSTSRSLAYSNYYDSIDEECYAPSGLKAKKSKANSLAPHSKRTSRKTAFKGTFNVQETTGKDIGDIQTDVLVCRLCECVYITTVNYNAHFVKNHGQAPPIPYQVKFDGKCRHPRCSFNSVTIKSYNVHIQVQHAAAVKMAYEQDGERDVTVTVTERNQSLAETATDQPSAFYTAVPNIIFKCDQCPLHYFAACIAFKHAVQCKQPRTEWKCDQCDRFFRTIDRERHILQHKVSSDIKVLVISREVAQMTMAKCAQCGVAFDDRIFLQSHVYACENTESVVCKLCGLKIEKTFQSKHFKMHNTELDFVIVEWVRGHEAPRPAAEPKRSVRKYYKHNRLYYCTLCNLYNHARTKFHITGQCSVLKRSSRRTCKLCGLCFTLRAFSIHMKREHSKKKFNLTDFAFYDISTLNRILPPLPEWKKCTNCKINFFGQTALHRHKCFEENFRNCSKCEEGFSDLAYKLHYAFHKYAPDDPIDEEIPEILKKYESMKSLWNIIYLCEVCDIVFDSYDSAIEHSQDHLSQLKDFGLRITKCLICELNFDSASYARHATLHANHIKKSSFEILKFNFENLLTDAWMKIFEPLSSEQRDHILAKSVYGAERGLRLYLESEGSASNTLFKCNICNSIVDKGSITEHAREQDACAQIKHKFSCADCGSTFRDKATLLSHQSCHSAHAQPIRLIAFNEKTDFALNEALYNIQRKGNLKFNWCKECGLLIKKDVFTKHVMKHKAKRKLGYIAKKGVKASSKRFDVYKCHICSLAVLNQSSVKNHTCSPKSCYEKCHFCNLVMKKTSMSQHYVFHKRQPSFNQKNINVIPFNGTAAARNKFNALFTLYECQKCKACCKDKHYCKEHVCATDGEPLHSCDTCNVSFRKNSYGHHLNLHKRYPNLTQADITVIKHNDVKPTKRKIDQIATYAKAKVPMFAILYQCECQILFVTRSGLVDHMRKCARDDEIENCPTCHLQFHASELPMHAQLHKCQSINSYLVGTVEIRYKHTNLEKRWIALCATCGVHYMNTRAIIAHLTKGHNAKAKNRRCVKCDAVFGIKGLWKHTKKHHREMKCTVNSLNLVVFNSVPAASLKQLFAKARAIKDASPVKASDDCAKMTVYKCTECSLHYTNAKGMIYHYARSQHSKKRFACKYCGLHFTSLIVKRHERTPHTIDDITVTLCANTADEYNSNAGGIVKIPSPVEAIVPKKGDRSFADIPSTSTDVLTEEQARIQSEVRRRFANTPLEALKVLHQCNVCHANCLHQKTLHSHMLRRRHPTQLLPCQLCGYLFTINSVAKHVYMHHTLLNLKREDFKIWVYTSHKHHTEIDAISGPSETQTDIEATDGITLQEASSSDALVRTDKPITDNETPTDTNINAPKLYKCGPCDVYFTSYDLCSEHSTDHTELDHTEYITCKLCDLQIICECIAAHMRGHREQTFKIDELYVIEFQPSDRPGPPSTSGYFAADRLKSLISTTTDCE